MTEEAPKETLIQRNDRDGFFKMALVAFAANFYAHNHQIDPKQIIEKCAHMAELAWEALAEYRQKHDQ